MAAESSMQVRRPFKQHTCPEGSIIGTIVIPLADGAATAAGTALL